MIYSEFSSEAFTSLVKSASKEYSLGAGSIEVKNFYSKKLAEEKKRMAMTHFIPATVAAKQEET